jgi:hypothetical protein
LLLFLGVPLKAEDKGDHLSGLMIIAPTFALGQGDNEDNVFAISK